MKPLPCAHTISGCAGGLSNHLFKKENQATHHSRRCINSDTITMPEKTRKSLLSRNTRKRGWTT
jgi:peptide methionine sulfoxide reductase MsrB